MIQKLGGEVSDALIGAMSNSGQGRARAITQPQLFGRGIIAARFIHPYNYALARGAAEKLARAFSRRRRPSRRSAGVRAVVTPGGGAVRAAHNR
jgi:hypothetical protein